MSSVMSVIPFIFFFMFHGKTTSSAQDDFTFNGFSSANLSLDGIASITSNGLLQMTNNTSHMKGHAFQPIPLRFKSDSGKPLSFSTTFVFAILPDIPFVGGDGMAFVMSRTTNLSTAFASQFLGLFNVNNNGNSTNHIFAVELDTFLNSELSDINNNHVGIDVNGLISNASHAAGYYEDTTGLLHDLRLASGKPMQVWIDFEAETMQLNVTLSSMQMLKPSRPLLSSVIDFATHMPDLVYVGFSSSTGKIHVYHYILGWSLKMNGLATPLDYAKLPSLPLVKTKDGKKALWIWLPIATCSLLLMTVVSVVLKVRRRKKYAELLEDWEVEYGPHRFQYKDLYLATQGFKDGQLLGAGGFGRVYKGSLPSSGMEVAVKKVSHESRQGMKQFVAEIVSIGQMRHRNLVQLLGYCRRKGELFLVYDFMPNCSLDKYLFDHSMPTLSWAQRFGIIKGVASALLYLHQDWEQVVIHRDVKASNVLLDSEFNGRLGDFGLARLYDHGTDPQTTHVVGTTGYMAPEVAKTGKSTTATDVFSFGAFLFEVACGRRPVQNHPETGELLILTDWVLESWQRGVVLEMRDPRLGVDFSACEVELVLKLGLLCSNPMPAARPCMRQVVQFLEGDVALPDLPENYLKYSSLSAFKKDDYICINSFSLAGLTLSGITVGR